LIEINQHPGVFLNTTNNWFYSSLVNPLILDRSAQKFLGLSDWFKEQSNQDPKVVAARSFLDCQRRCYMRVFREVKYDAYHIAHGDQLNSCSGLHRWNNRRGTKEGIGQRHYIKLSNHLI
jgi:hypothetical protein